MNRLGIIAALAGEVRPLVRGWRLIARYSRGLRQAAWQGRIGQTECVVVYAGMGEGAASVACGIAEEIGDVEGFVSLGWAGALSCGLHAGHAYSVAEVIDAGTGDEFAAKVSVATGPSFRLVTTDHVAKAQEKRVLAERYQAVLVDMEAATVARMARQKGIAFYCVKAVSDIPADTLPDFSRYSDARGGLRMPSLLAHLAVQPKYWRSVARLSKNSKTGAQALVQALRELVETHANHVNR